MSKIRIAAALAVVGLMAGTPAFTQTAKPKPAKTAPAYKAPRGPDGKHPDLNGVWQALNNAHYNIEPHAGQSALQMRPGPFIPLPAKEVIALGAVGAVPAGPGIVEGGQIPYTEEARKLRDENRADYLNRDPEVKCYLPGVPRANYMPFPLQIFQSDKSMLIAYEYAGATRTLLFDDPGPPPVDSWMGQSVAKWEGDTLVVTVTGQSDRTWFDRAGNHHSAEMTVVERWTPTGPGTMRYEATITDPATFTKPWKLSVNLYKRVGEDAKLGQFKCVEFVEELMYGHLRKEPVK